MLLTGLLAGGLLGPGYLQKYRSPKEQAGPRAIAILCCAEAEHRWYDRDGNGIKDFWTADVAGLYQYGLTPREIAEADTSPLIPPLVPTPILFKGYYFRVFRVDDSETPPVVYRQDTDKKSGRVHNLERFGVVAYPTDSNGKYFYMISENMSVFRAAATIPRPMNWFTDVERRNYWGLPQ